MPKAAHAAAGAIDAACWCWCYDDMLQYFLYYHYFHTLRYYYCHCAILILRFRYLMPLTSLRQIHTLRHITPRATLFADTCWYTPQFQLITLILRHRAARWRGARCCWVVIRFPDAAYAIKRDKDGRERCWFIEMMLSPPQAERYCYATLPSPCRWDFRLRLPPIIFRRYYDYFELQRRRATHAIATTDFRFRLLLIDAYYATPSYTPRWCRHNAPY